MTLSRPTGPADPRDPGLSAPSSAPAFQLRLARDAQDLKAAQRLRYEVFVAELGGDGPMVDHDARLETDRFDPFYDHLLLIDPARDPDTLSHVVGVYRLLRGDRAEAVGQFYSDDEYDLSLLRAGGRPLLELGRSCLHPAYRGGSAMYHLWNGLAEYVADHGIEILFGTASFHGTDIAALAQPLSHLHHAHLAPPDMRVRPHPHVFQRMDLLPPDQIDRKAAMLATPALIKGYLRMGGYVGDGAFVDHAFNTTDVCLVMDTTRMNNRQRDLYTRERSRAGRG
ncbi:ornithine-acyl-ACP acyltransferase [Pacificitalea manganoxidans]|uniref:L-ornithine N(alpha)-acyltransferase n=1 Tax=Pacificitalea manganoxidans TaxID=1411902 RepID=A0A291LZS1_9RHOB|nr:GNAT family N-acyltransferase [Pacificitalea manganoxidans]ATI42211.1 ornithine-acyl-ACP acyltransferase [Pacificitalea manganoxidans]MDR6307973.1 putative hemolysin [Pacificitalea manganoxidans]